MFDRVLNTPLNFLKKTVYGTKYSRMDQVNSFKGCLPQILLGPFLNILIYIYIYIYINIYIYKYILIYMYVILQIQRLFRVSGLPKFQKIYGGGAEGMFLTMAYFSNFH